MDVHLTDLSLDALNLLGDLDRLLGLLLVHALKLIKLVAQTRNDGLLAVELGLKVCLQGSGGHLESLFTAA